MMLSRLPVSRLRSTGLPLYGLSCAVLRPLVNMCAVSRVLSTTLPCTVCRFPSTEYGLECTTCFGSPVRSIPVFHLPMYGLPCQFMYTISNLRSTDIWSPVYGLRYKASRLKVYGVHIYQSTRCGRPCTQQPYTVSCCLTSISLYLCRVLSACVGSPVYDLSACIRSSVYQSAV